MFALQGHLDAYVLVSLVGEEMIDNGEISGRLSLPVSTDTLIYCRQIVQRAERLVDSGFQVTEGLARVLRIDPERRDPVAGDLLREHLFAQALPKVLRNL